MLAKIMVIIMFCFVTLAVSANSDPNKTINLEDGRSIISIETSDIQAIEAIIEKEGLTYSELSEKYPTLLATANIASSANEEGILDSSSDSPLGIGGFWWGLVLGCLGIVIVYIAMDEGSDRKEQVKNSIIGCLLSSVFFSLYRFTIY